MMAMPLGVPLLGKRLLIPWIWLIAWAMTSKLRSVGFAARVAARCIPFRLIAALLPITFIEFYIWATPLIDIVHPARREQW
jgi:hypothetical protein